MNETIEDRLRRVLTESALTEVPDSSPIPPRRREPLPSMAGRSSRRWLGPAVVGVAAAVIAVVATLVVTRGPASVSSGPASLSSGPALLSSGTTHVSLPPPVASGPAVTTDSPTGPTYAKVPADLVGKSYNEAVDELTVIKLSVVRQVVDSNLPVDQVVAVVGAAPAESVQTGTPITLQVSNNSMFVVPSLANLTLEQASTRLRMLGWTGTGANFVVKTAPTTDSALVGRIPSEPQPLVLHPGTAPNEVTRVPAQSPAIGQNTKKSTAFTILVYAEKEVVLPAFQPGVTLLTDLEAELAGQGFSAVSVVIKTPALPPASPHTVISVTPSGAGSLVPFDTPIVVTAWGEPPVVSQTTTVTK